MKLIKEVTVNNPELKARYANLIEAYDKLNERKAKAIERLAAAQDAYNVETRAIAELAKPLTELGQVLGQETRAFFISEGIVTQEEMKTHAVALNPETFIAKIYVKEECPGCANCQSGESVAPGKEHLIQ